MIHGSVRSWMAAPDKSLPASAVRSAADSATVLNDAALASVRAYSRPMPLKFGHCATRAGAALTSSAAIFGRPAATRRDQTLPDLVQPPEKLSAAEMRGLFSAVQSAP